VGRALTAKPVPITVMGFKDWQDFDPAVQQLSDIVADSRDGNMSDLRPRDCALLQMLTQIAWRSDLLGVSISFGQMTAQLPTSTGR
jgi:hypothetical protein